MRVKFRRVKKQTKPTQNKTKKPPNHQTINPQTSKNLLIINLGSKSKTENGIQMNFVSHDQNCREQFTRNSESGE